MNENDQRDAEQQLDAPAKLLAALKESSRQKVFVPTYVDQTVLDAARRHLSQPKKSSAGIFRRWMLLPALATGCVVIAFIITLLLAPAVPRFAREDLNRDGHVDILDSFALARELKTGRPLPAVFDVNGDGAVDERDVALIAAHAVAIGKENRS
jgi:hypothetical protein